MNTLQNVQSLIDQIRKLNTEQLELILKEVFETVEQKRKINLIFDDFIGSGTRIWNIDAQEHVNSLREDR